MVTSDENDLVRIKAIYNGEARITYTNRHIGFENFETELKSMCLLEIDNPVTVKWVDEEGDPCTISSELELTECFRLYDVNKDNEVVMYVFPSHPARPGLPCKGEDRSIYRRGARRWRKLYHVNGHLYQAKRFSRKALCSYCSDNIWGLGLQGFKCVNCKLMVHKRCHKLYKEPCRTRQALATTPTPQQGTPLAVPTSNAQTATLPTPSKVSTPGSAGSSPLSEENATTERTTPATVSADKKQPAQSEFLAGQPEEAPRLLEDGEKRLEQFDLIRVIGRGSYAKVMMVEHKKSKRIYAMKVIKKELVADEEDIEWVQTEKHVFEIASNHPFLVGLHSCFQTVSRLFFIIEFVNGGDLMFHMQRQRRLPEDHARFYAAEIAIGLHFLHERGIIYRDLKLDNVLLDAEGHIKLTDYGMCKEGLHDGEKTSTFCGTPNYIAPEILRGEEYDYSVDWWALGVLLYEMLAGRSPFDLGNMDNPETNSEEYLFQVILEKVIRIPRSLSVKAAQILKGFLNKNQFERLGCTAEGFGEIRNHAFFKSIDWDVLEKRQVPPPYKPNIKSDRDLDFFDPQFTNEPVVLTPDDTKKIANIDQSEFDGFEYTNPFLMTQEDSV